MRWRESPLAPWRYGIVSVARAYVSGFCDPCTVHIAGRRYRDIPTWCVVAFWPITVMFEATRRSEWPWGRAVLGAGVREYPEVKP
jgi:hypothetical protein